MDIYAKEKQREPVYYYLINIHFAGIGFDISPFLSHDNHTIVNHHPIKHKTSNSFVN